MTHDAIPNVFGDAGTQREMEPVISTAEVMALSKRGYFAGTGTHQVGGSEELHTKIENPANSGVLLVLTNRRFGVEHPDEPLEYRAVINPTATLTEPMTGFNSYLGADPSAAILSYQVAAPIDMGGIEGTVNFTVEDFEFPVVIPQGFSVAFMIEGVGGGGAGSQQYMALNFNWFEVPA